MRVRSEPTLEAHELIFLDVIDEEEKSFIRLTPGPNVMKNFLRSYFTNVRNKLECFVLYKPFQPEPTQVKHLSGTPLYGMALALPTNIRLGWKGQPGTDTLAYYKLSYITTAKKFFLIIDT